jgi:hypothetical protein
MTNNSIFSRRACVERIEILSDGRIPQVETTSLGFEKSLSPYRYTPADTACVLRGGCFITERNILSRSVANITNGCVVGYKYFDFGEDYSSKTMEFSAKIRGCGSEGQVRILVDDWRDGMEIGRCSIGPDDAILYAVVRCVTGRHALYFVFEDKYGNVWDWAKGGFENRPICELEGFVFHK